MLRPYKPSGPYEEGSLLPLVGATLIAAVAGGAVVHLVGTWIRLLIVFPALMGACAGIGANIVVKGRRIRAPLLVAVVGALGGLAAWSTDFGIGYARMRSVAVDEIAAFADEASQAGVTSTPESRTATVDALLAAMGRGEAVGNGALAASLAGAPFPDENGVEVQPLAAASSFDALLGYTRFQASLGTTIEHNGHDSGKLDATGTFVLWVIEILVAMLVGVVVPYLQAREPYCEKCRVWYAKEEVTLSVADYPNLSAVTEAVRHGDPSALARTVAKGSFGKKGFVGLSRRSCPRSASCEAYVQVFRVRTSGKKVNRKNHLTGLMGAETADNLWKAVKEAAGVK